MFRKLAVPLALENYRRNDDDNRVLRTLRLSEEDSEDSRLLLTMATNRMRLKKLERDLENERFLMDPEDVAEELDFIKTSIKVSLMELRDELSEVPTAEELFQEALA